jgi:carboxymethylenebutenolidase
MLLHYAGLDERVNEGMAGYEEALKAAGVDYEMHVYEGANHAFNNDASEARYHKEAAELAWLRTIQFLKDALS